MIDSVERILANGVKRILLLMVSLVGFTQPVPGQAPPRAGSDGRALPPVEISEMRDPVAKSYRRIMRGVEVFERRRDLAPNASLRFRLLPRDRATDMQGISLRIVGETFAVPIALSPDNTFTLPRDQRLLDQNAIVVPNRKAGSMTWRTDIRTPGLPPNTRRLGDLRLECLVGMESGLISNYPPTIFGEVARLIAERRYCEQREPRYLFFAERPLWSVTLVHGNRRELLSVDRMYAGASRQPLTDDDRKYCDCEVLLDRTYFAPLGDSRWPDDTLLEFEYMDSPPKASAP